MRQLCQRFAASRGHYSIVGTPKEVVDEMQRWFENGACDGFNFVPSVYPIGLNDFVDLVIPELQRRGLSVPPMKADAARCAGPAKTRQPLCRAGCEGGGVSAKQYRTHIE